MDYTFLSEEVIEWLAFQKVKLVGVDTPNIDNDKNLDRPAHPILLKQNILIVENLTNPNSLPNKVFSFFAIPIKVLKATAMPIRAFALI